MTMKIGAQLYTVRNFCQSEGDIDASFAKVAQMGYEYIQVSGLADIGAENMRRLADKHELKIILSHSSPDRVRLDTDKLIAEHKIMGADYIGIGSMPEGYRGSRAGVEAFIADFLPAAQNIAAAGLHFMYHNHDFEFAKIDGKLVFDYLVEGFSPREMGFVLDTFWVQAGGDDPAVWLKKLAGRLDTIHFKDYGMSADGKRIMLPILEGNLNWERIFAACEDSGAAYAFIEQDDCNGADPFECLKLSLDNLRARGY